MLFTYLVLCKSWILQCIICTYSIRMYSTCTYLLPYYCIVSFSIGHAGGTLADEQEILETIQVRLWCLLVPMGAAEKEEADNLQDRVCRVCEGARLSCP